MASLKNEWKLSSRNEIIVIALKLICSVGVIVLILLSMFDVVDKKGTTFIVMPLLAIVTGCNAIVALNRSKRTAVLYLAYTVIILAAYVVILGKLK